MDGRTLTVLYGSETGTAADIAEEIWRESKKFYFQTHIMAMDNYNVENLITEDLVVFVVSTTGQGDEPFNMKNFWKFLLKKNLPLNSLAEVNVAVLGLGDSSYTKFNFVAKRLYKRLMQLSAISIMQLGLCDDQHDMGLSAVYLPWKNELWETLLKIKPLPTGVQPLSEVPQQFKWTVNIVNDKTSTLNSNFNHWENQAIAPCPTFEACVQNNIRTTAIDHFQDVRLIAFSVCENVWMPGDVVCIRPKNSIAQVYNLFALFKEHNLNWFPDTVVKIQEISSDMPVPDFLRHQLTLKDIATEYWDLQAIPRTRVFELLTIHNLNELEKEKLIEFTTSTGQEELYAYVNRPKRTILEVLQDFPHASSKLTLQLLFEMFAPIRPRSFSIASSPKSETLDILVAVVEYKTNLKATRKGLCSNWLKNLVVGNKVPIWLKKGTFTLPMGQNVPVVMVGPGTGLAPFRSILQHQKLSGEPCRPLILFFGCRNKDKDFHCREELEEMVASGQLQLITAFSRDQDHKIYIQHRIIEEHQLINDLLSDQQGYFLLSGSSKNMPQSVQDALREVLIDKSLLDHMLKSGRYQEETWS